MNPNRFIVVRDFWKLWSYILEYTENEHRMFVGDSNTLRACAWGDTQVVVMGGPDAKNTYSEYKPYTVLPHYDENFNKIKKMVIDGKIYLPINRWMKGNPYVENKD